MDPQCSHWTCSNKSSALSQETQEKTGEEIPRESLHPISTYPSRRQDSSDLPCLASHQYPSPKRFDVNARPAHVLSKDPLQDAIDATYFRYLLTPDHTSVEAWIHNTILAQFPDSPPSTKTLPLYGGDIKPSLHNKQQQQQQQQSPPSILVPSQSPSSQAHQNAYRTLTNISPNPQKRKQPVHYMVEDIPPFAEDLHLVWKQPASTCLSDPLTRRISQCSASDAKSNYSNDLNHSLSTTDTQLSPLPTLTTIIPKAVPSLVKPPSQPLTLAPQSRVTRSTATKRRNTTQEKVTRSTALSNHPLPRSLQPITLQPRIAKLTKAKRWTTMNCRRGPSRGAAKDSKEAAEPITIYNQGQEDILQGQRNGPRLRNRRSAPLQGLGSPNPRPTGTWSRPTLPERTNDASLQEHHPSPSQLGGPGQSNDDLNHERRSGQDKPDIMYSTWAPPLETLGEFSPSDPPGDFIAPTLATPVRARGQQITFVEAGQPTPGEELVCNERTQRPLFPSQQSANFSPHKKPTAPRMSLNANMKGVPLSPAKQSQSSQGTKSSTPSGRSKLGCGKTFSHIVTLDEIDMKYLATCEPSIDLQTLELVKTKFKPQTPNMVRDFLKIWAAVPRTFIPNQLKEYYESRHRKLGDTPMTPRKVDFLEGHYAGFHHKQLEKLAMLVSQVIERSIENHSTDTYERHWGASTVYALLNEVVCWPHPEDNREKAYDIEAYNIENCAIEMQEYFIVRSNDDETITKIEPVTRGIPTATGSIKKMVDWSLALKLDDLEKDDTNDAFRRLRDLERAFNQTNRWYREKVAFLDFEIKSETSGVKPLVQLAAWAGGLYLKRRHHNWSTDAPSLGVSVVGAEWSLYVTFEREPGKLIMMGPLPFGSTRTLNGTWEIVFKLKFIAQWGCQDFRTWFQDNIINWCRWKANKPLNDLHSIREQEKQEEAKQALTEQWMKPGV